MMDIIIHSHGTILHHDHGGVTIYTTTQTLPSKGEPRVTVSFAEGWLRDVEGCSG